MAKHQLTPQEWERLKLQKEIEFECEMAGVSRDLGVPPPTKEQQLADRHFDDEERTFIFLSLIECDNDADKALALYNQCVKADGSRLKPMTRTSIREFRKRHMEDYFKEITSEIGISVMLETMKSKAVNDQTRWLAAQYGINRSEGMPTQRTENLTVTYTFDDVEREKAKAMEMLKESGSWYNPTDSTTPDAESPDK